MTLTWVSAGAREAGDEEPLRPAHDPRLHRVHAASPHTGIAHIGYTASVHTEDTLWEF